jgi:predicted nucleic acid-binding protein
MTAGRDRRIFVYTAAYFAAASKRDSDFLKVSSTMRRLLFEGRRFITTNFIVAELHALLLSRHSIAEALEIVTRLRESPATNVVRIRTQDEERAW